MPSFVARPIKKLTPTKRGSLWAALIAAATVLMGAAEVKFNFVGGGDIEDRVTRIEKARAADSAATLGLRDNVRDIKEDTEYLRNRLDKFLDNRYKD